MAYSNWGENLANSFMSMYQANNQKKLENERIGLERDRLGLERQRTEDAMKTSLLQRTEIERAMAKQEEEDAYFAAHPLYLDMDGNTANGKEFTVDARRAGYFNNNAFTEYDLPTFVNGQAGSERRNLQNYAANNLIQLASDNANRGANMWDSAQNRESNLAAARIQAGATQANTAAIREENKLQRYRDASMVASNAISASGRYLTQAQKESLVLSISEGYGLSVEEATQIVESETNAFVGKQYNNGRQDGVAIKPTNGVISNFNTPGVQG